MSMLILFESRYTLKGMYNIGNVGQTASMSMLTLFESRYTLKGRYNIGNVDETASVSMLTLFESRYTLKGRYNIGNVGKTVSMSMFTFFESRYTTNQRAFLFNTESNSWEKCEQAFTICTELQHVKGKTMVFLPTSHQATSPILIQSFCNQLLINVVPFLMSFIKGRRSEHTDRNIKL